MSMAARCCFRTLFFGFCWRCQSTKSKAQSPKSKVQTAQPMSFTFINPQSLGAARGYSNGVLTAAGARLLFVAGQVAWDENQKVVSSDFVEQFQRALTNLITVVSAAGGRPEQIVRLVIYVTDKNAYCSHTREIGECYRALMGRHFPAMVLVEVKSLLDDEAKVEIEGIAAL